MKNGRWLGLLVVGASFAGCGQRGESLRSDELSRPGEGAPNVSTERADDQGSGVNRVGGGHEADSRTAVGGGSDRGASVQPGLNALDPSKVRVCTGIRVVEKFEIASASGHDIRGNTQLSPITERGTVPCMHAEDLTIAECTFHADPRSTESFVPGGQKGSSGNWVLGGDGKRYAQLGQAIGREGVPGGDYVIARRSPKGGENVPCVAPEAHDSAGTPAGCELTGGSMMETMLSAANASGLPLVNYATREVCTSSYPHPDNATLVRIASDGSYCYRYVGAALNDINGMERDSTGAYYGACFGDVLHTHYVWSNGYEVPGAKRPATKTYPAPGSIVTTTPIVWRPVTPVKVAND